MKKHTILFLAANPLYTDQLALAEEAREIQAVLERSGYRDHFEFVTRWAAQPLDLLRELLKLKPTVVHFSGHGSRSERHVRNEDHSPGRDIHTSTEDKRNLTPGSIYFQDGSRRAAPVPTEALAQTFAAAGSSVEVVVLNACYSEVHADALLDTVKCVVGMNGSIRDESAKNFAIGFYTGLGERESVAAACKQGRAAVMLEGMSDENEPRLKVRMGVDANNLFLAVASNAQGNDMYLAFLMEFYQLFVINPAPDIYEPVDIAREHVQRKLGGSYRNDIAEGALNRLLAQGYVRARQAGEVIAAQITDAGLHYLQTLD